LEQQARFWIHVCANNAASLPRGVLIDLDSRHLFLQLIPQHLTNTRKLGWVFLVAVIRCPRKMAREHTSCGFGLSKIDQNLVKVKPSAVTGEGGSTG
jgi:hypothetical protein